MNDSELPEKEIVLDGVEQAPTPSVDQQLNAMSRESKVYLGGHTTQEQFVPSKLKVQQSTTSKKVLLLVGGLLLLALLGALVWALVDKSNVSAELASTQSKLAEAVTTANRYKLAAENQVSETEPKTESPQVTFQTFLAQYAELTGGLGSTTAQSGRDYTLTSADETAVENAIKAYYKISELPEGWAALGARKDATGAVHSLVYWPKSVTKPAGFMTVTKASTSASWKYNEQP